MNKKQRVDRSSQNIKISNAEPEIVKHIIKNFKKSLFINKDLIRASITYNSKNKNFVDNNFKKFWSKLSGIPLENFTKSTICKKYASKKSPFGILQIRYNNSILFDILINLMRKIRRIILSNKYYTEAYLRGLAAAEGGVGKVYNRKTEGLRIVFISSMSKGDKRFYIKCLKKLGITSYNTYPLRIEIYGKANFLKLYKFNLFKYNPERKINFIKYLKTSYPFITDSGTNLHTLLPSPS